MSQGRHGSAHDLPSALTRLDHLYERFGVGYLAGVLSSVFVITCLFAGFDMGVLQLYRDVGMKDFAFLLGLGELVNLAGLVIGLALFGAQPIWRLAKWTRTGDGSDILGLIVDLPWRVVPPIALTIMVLEIPAIIYFSSQTGAEVPIVVVLIAILAPNGTAAFFVYLILEYLLRPIARSAVVSQPAVTHGLPRPAVSLRRKLLFGLPIVNFMTAYVSVALTGNATSVGGRLALGVAAALAVTLTVSLVLTTTLARSFNDPIDELVAATDRVAKGDLSASVMAFGADEMGTLASRFNQMVAGLAERERIHQAFGTYVDKEVAEHILRNGTSLVGEEVEVTMMFIDIRGFTAFSEHATPPDVVATVNRMFDRAVPIVHAHGGHIDKFVGDGLLAVFGAPRRQIDHADQALAAALEIEAAVQEEFEGKVGIGIGLNSGRVVAGNVGGGGRFEFSVIGDAVNVAARVESATRQTGDTVLITENTRQLLCETARATLVARPSVPLKGRVGSVRLYGISSKTTQSTSGLTTSESSEAPGLYEVQAPVTRTGMRPRKSPDPGSHDN